MEVQKSMSRRMSTALKAVPKKTEDEIGIQLNIFIDMLVSTTCILLGQYVNLSAEFEDKVVQGVREKFSVLRKNALSGKHI